MPKEIKSNFLIENGKLLFRNFSGKEGQYNPEGMRNFCVLLEQTDATMLEKDGWNVRYLEPRDPDDPLQPYLPVAVSYSYAPPLITVINSTGKTILDEDAINILDWAEIEKVDLVIRPYNWEHGKKRGVKAYLKTMYVTIVEDELEKKYRNVPDSGTSFDNDRPPFS